MPKAETVVTAAAVGWEPAAPSTSWTDDSSSRTARSKAIGRSVEPVAQAAAVAAAGLAAMAVSDSRRVVASLAAAEEERVATGK